MTIRSKLILGFSTLTGILLIFGVLSWLYIGWLGKNVDEIVEWKVPAVKLAVNVHAGAYAATIEQLNYLLYEKEESYKQAQVVLAKMNQDLSRVDQVGQKFDDQALLKQSAAVRVNVKDFGQLYDKGVQALIDNKEAVDVIEANGDRVLAEADSFALKQEVEYAALRKSNADQYQLNTKVQKYILVNRIKSLAYIILQYEKQERLYKDRVYYQKMLKKLPDLMGLYNQLQKITQDKTELNKIAVARGATDKYSEAVALWIKNDTELKQIVNQMNIIATNVRDSAANVESDGWTKVTEMGEKTVALVSQAHLIILVTLFVGVLVGAGLSFVIPKNIVSSINALSAFSKSFGQGDLTVRTHFAARDEIGVMAQDFEKAARNLQSIILQVSDNAQVLSEHSNDLSQTVDRNTDNIQKQRQYTEQVATAMNEMAATVVEVARNATQAASAANDANVQSVAGNNVVSKAVNSINSLANEIDQASTVIKQLESDVKGIGAILDVIRSVSEQTNLLALNAAIEAARAGEHGRGFAVVADEVRTLASRTQASTNEIQTMIEKLQAGAEKAVVTMGTSHKMAGESVKLASESGEALEAIIQSVIVINDMNSHISTATDQQSSVAEEVNQSIVTINSLSEETVEAATETSSASSGVSTLADELRQAVSKFKV